MTTKPIGILGWTGLVGQTLVHQLLAAGINPHSIATYNSKNLGEIRGAVFDTLYIACMPATKWWANLYPAEDRKTLDQVLEALESVQATHVVLLSTVDVLGNNPSEWAAHAYGQHRQMLESWIFAKWPQAHVLRLPALFGRGLKKNALYDLLHDNQLSNICLDSAFQWYNLARLLGDCRMCISKNIRILHPVSPPISMRTIVQRWFPEKLAECTGTTPVQYNVTTPDGAGAEGPYWNSKDVVLRDMGDWIAWERWRMTHKIAASNIGFQMTTDVAACLRHLGVNCLEVAPTRGTYYADFTPISMQSLLYGTNITNIFSSPSFAFFDHLRNLMRSAYTKGIRTFVFGSPKQRDLLVSWEEARDFFGRLGDLAAEYDITVCLEPNARAYGCTWLTNVADTLLFVQSVNHPNIRLSLDSGNYCMEEDTFPLTAIPMEWIGHIQISAAHLGSQLTQREQEVATTFAALWKRGYTGTISYEAREVAIKEYCRGLGQFMDILYDTFKS